ncbi:MAG: hypothetical protein JXR70_02315 [Spirochaetales bacterium]|nr:hypothetical protein [Spirochaetales bacterium]
MKYFLLIFLVSLASCDISSQGFFNNNHTKNSQNENITEPFIANHNVVNLDIAEEYITKIKQNLNIHFAGRSHAAQVSAFGLKELAKGDSKFEYVENTTKSIPTHNNQIINVTRGLPFISELDKSERYEDESFIEPHHYFGGPKSDVNWDRNQGPYIIENYLDSNFNKFLINEEPLINVCVYMFCSELGSIWGGNNNGDNMAKGYLRAMENLITMYESGGSKGRTDYTAVIFVFATAHGQYSKAKYGSNPVSSYADQQGAMVWKCNELIRNHCIENKRWLFDFADMDYWGLTNGRGNFFGNFDWEGTWSLSPSRRAQINFDGITQSIEFRSCHEVWGPYDFSANNLLKYPEITGYTGNPYHTRPEHAEIKAKAFWYLMAKILGYNE